MVLLGFHYIKDKGGDSYVGRRGEERSKKEGDELFARATPPTTPWPTNAKLRVPPTQLRTTTGDNHPCRKTCKRNAAQGKSTFTPTTLPPSSG